MSPVQPAGKSRSQFAINLFNGASHRYDIIAQTLSYGQYRRWQGQLIRMANLHGIGAQSTVLDVATGTAGVAVDLVRATGCQVIGLDQSPGMLSAARDKLASLPESTTAQITLVEGTANNLPFAGEQFDGLTFTYLFRYINDPAATLRELVRVVRPGGFVGFIEFHVPPPPWKQLWYLHTRLVLPLTGYLISPGWYEVGTFLGPSIERFYANWDTASLVTMLNESGLHDVDYRVMSLGGGLVMWGRKGSGNG